MKHPTNNAGAKTQGRKVEAEPIKLQKRIGSTTYRVNVYFSDTAMETMDDKILRLIRNEIASQGVAQPDARDYEVAA